MTQRMVAAMAHPDSDILGHCTGRLVTGRGRPESEFDVDAVLDTCLRFDKALEINCRPERLDPPRSILRRAVELGVKVSIDTDSHAAEQLEWQPFEKDLAECAVPGVSDRQLVAGRAAPRGTAATGRWHYRHTR